MPNLNDLIGYLTERNLSFRQCNENRIIFELKFYRDDGRANKEELEVLQKSDLLFVRATNDRYPILCPNRHINEDGWFCLGLFEDISQFTIASVYFTDFLENLTTFFIIHFSLYPIHNFRTTNKQTISIRHLSQNKLF